MTGNTEAIGITSSQMGKRMRRLLANEDFQILRGQWLNTRDKILRRGKKNHSESEWSLLEGFDLAIQEPEKWALRYDKKEEEADPTGDLDR